MFPLNWESNVRKERMRGEEGRLKGGREANTGEHTEEMLCKKTRKRQQS